MTYEYKHFNEKLSESRMNSLGAEGWKLVSHTAVTTGYEFGQYYIFIREIEEYINTGPK